MLVVCTQQCDLRARKGAFTTQNAYLACSVILHGFCYRGQSLYPILRRNP